MRETDREKQTERPYSTLPNSHKLYQLRSLRRGSHLLRVPLGTLWRVEHLHRALYRVLLHDEGHDAPRLSRIFCRTRRRQRAHCLAGLLRGESRRHDNVGTDPGKRLNQVLNPHPTQIVPVRLCRHHLLVARLVVAHRSAAGHAPQEPRDLEGSRDGRATGGDKIRQEEGRGEDFFQGGLGTTVVCVETENKFVTYVRHTSERAEVDLCHAPGCRNPPIWWLRAVKQANRIDATISWTSRLGSKEGRVRRRKKRGALINAGRRQIGGVKGAQRWQTVSYSIEMRFTSCRFHRRR